MKRICLGVVVLMMGVLAPLLAMAGALEEAEPITGVCLYPQGAGEQEARYVFRFACPQFAAQTEADEAINAYYRLKDEELRTRLFEQSAAEATETLEAGMPAAYTQIDYQISHNDDRYVSVVMITRQFAGNGESETLAAATFARDGLYAGQPLTLSQLTGLEQETQEERPTLAEELAYRLVWEIVREGMSNVDGDYLDGISEQTLRGAFTPETDFYLDENENVVFFIQPGVLAGEVAGVLLFPFSSAELLSAAGE